MEENRIPKMVLYMNLGTTSLRVGPRNRWQDEEREDGRIDTSGHSPPPSRSTAKSTQHYETTTFSTE